MTRVFPILLALALGQEALAAGYSADIELVRPSLSDGAIFSVQSPRVPESGTLSLGMYAQYEDSPLVLYEGENAGAVVKSRTMWHLGMTYALADRFAFGITLPVSGTWGTEVPALAADGFAAGDALLGAQVLIVDTRAFDLGAGAGLSIPIGTRNAFVGETAPRGFGDLMAMVDAGPVELVGNLGLTGRQPVLTTEDFALGAELTMQGGPRVWVYQEVVAVQAAMISRGGFTSLFQGGAENSSEIIGGVHIKPTSPLSIDVGGGAGLTEGYGTTDLRLLAGLVWRYKAEPPPPEPEIPEYIVREAPVVDPQEDIEIPPDPPPVVEWQPEELARVEEDRIVIRDPIQYEFATDRVLPISIPTLEYVAKLMNEDARIAQLVIEGHASDEGSFEYNFDLSNSRAKQVFRELIRAGVHPNRLSYRGMGEVVPIKIGDDETTLAANRRVEFHIVTQLAPGDDFPEYPEEILLPWSGEKAKVHNPEPPPPPEPAGPPPPPVDPLDPANFSQPGDDEVFNFDRPAEDETPLGGEDAAAPPPETETKSRPEPAPPADAGGDSEAAPEPAPPADEPPPEASEDVKERPTEEPAPEEGAP